MLTLQWKKRISVMNKAMKNFAGLAVMLLTILSACSKSGSHSDYLLNVDSDYTTETFRFGLDQVARVFAALPIGAEQVSEVHDAVNGSISRGYDEEYTMRQLFEAPGCGVGENGVTKAGMYRRPLRELLREYLYSETATKSRPYSGEEFLEELEKSDLQIYWPYSDEWDGEKYPIITFDPGYESDYNYGYRLRRDEDGELAVDSVYVDEKVAMSEPVWVINSNCDGTATPLPLYVPDESEKGLALEGASTKGMNRILRMKSFTMLRHYDSWFQGGSEFFIKCGSVNGFSASTEAELKLYSPSVTDFMVVVKRKYLNVEREYNAIILTNFTNQLDNLAFLVTEDDGGATTSWKCSATVKIKSKSYGFDVDIPYKENDDIVWRGQLAASFFQSEDIVTGRFGDVIIKFALD